ncbi:hypothetical protein [Streptomyces sp. NPDC051909]|uniref:hypothetical protein n=1 Tax=Streptomyces sp. NPDC051909 TaxID=3154944 RepID=UPI003412FAD0
MLLNRGRLSREVMAMRPPINKWFSVAMVSLLMATAVAAGPAVAQSDPSDEPSATSPIYSETKEAYIPPNSLIPVYFTCSRGGVITFGSLTTSSSSVSAGFDYYNPGRIEYRIIARNDSRTDTGKVTVTHKCDNRRKTTVTRAITLEPASRLDGHTGKYTVQYIPCPQDFPVADYRTIRVLDASGNSWQEWARELTTDTNPDVVTLHILNRQTVPVNVAASFECIESDGIPFEP